MDISVSDPITSSHPVVSSRNIKSGFSSVDDIEDGFGQKVPFFKDFKDSVLPISTQQIKSHKTDEWKRDLNSIPLVKTNNNELTVLSRPAKRVDKQKSDNSNENLLSQIKEKTFLYNSKNLENFSDIEEKSYEIESTTKKFMEGATESNSFLEDAEEILFTVSYPDFKDKTQNLTLSND